MKYGFIITGPPDAPWLLEMAREVEAAGWDGVFYWDGFVTTQSNHDPFALLAAIAVQTKRVMLGAIIVPLPWRKPWLIARSIATVDQLSGGRLVLPVGLGAVHEPELEAGATIVGAPVDRKLRAERLDEGLSIVTGLASGKPFDYQGKHYRLQGVMVPPTVQQPRVPVWVVGLWGSDRSMRRVLQYDGWIPNGVEASHLPEVKRYLAQHSNIEYIADGRTPGDDPAAACAMVQPYADAGAAWWIEAMWSEPNGPGDIRRRIQQGPPRV